MPVRLEVTSGLQFYLSEVLSVWVVFGARGPWMCPGRTRGLAGPCRSVAVSRSGVVALWCCRVLDEVAVRRRSG